MSITGKHLGTIVVTGMVQGRGQAVSLLHQFIFILRIQPLQRFLYCLSVRRLYGVDDRRMMNWKGLYGSNRGLIDVLSQHLPGGTEENHRNPQAIHHIRYGNKVKMTETSETYSTEGRDQKYIQNFGWKS
jgi:hypothetical protein